VVEEMMVEIAAAADEDEDAPSKRAPSKRARHSSAMPRMLRQRQKWRHPPPLLIVLMSLISHLLNLRIHLILKSLLLQ